MVKHSTSARSPLSPTLWPPDAFRWWLSIPFAVALLGVLVVTAAGAAAFLIVFGIAHLSDLRNPTTLTLPLLLSQLAGYATGLAVLLLALPAIARRPLSALGLRRPRWSDLGWGIAGAGAMILAAMAAGALQESVVHVKADEVQVQWLRLARGPMIAGFVFLACVAAPFFEELAFRGFVFNAMLRYLPVPLATLGSAVLFGLAHMQAGNAGAILPLTAAGIVLTVVYYRTGSLVASMLTHAIFNLFTVVLVIAFHQT